MGIPARLNDAIAKLSTKLQGTCLTLNEVHDWWVREIHGEPGVLRDAIKFMVTEDLAEARRAGDVRMICLSGYTAPTAPAPKVKPAPEPEPEDEEDPDEAEAEDDEDDDEADEQPLPEVPAEMAVVPRPAPVQPKSAPSHVTIRAPVTVPPALEPDYDPEPVVQRDVKPPKETPMPTKKDWLSAAEAAELLGCTKQNLNSLVVRGRVKDRGAGTTREWSRASLEKYMAERDGTTTTAKSVKPPPNRSEKSTALAVVAKPGPAKVVTPAAPAAEPGDLRSAVRWLVDGADLGMLDRDEVLARIGALVR